jgi:hypothetical protein
MNNFYDTTSLSIDDKINILYDMYVESESYRVDILDTNLGWSRQKLDWDFDQIIHKFNNKSHFVIVERNNLIEGNYGEIGFSTLTSPSYFLFIFVTIETLNKLVNERGISKRIN